MSTLELLWSGGGEVFASEDNSEKKQTLRWISDLSREIDTQFSTCKNLEAVFSDSNRLPFTRMMKWILCIFKLDPFDDGFNLLEGFWRKCVYGPIILARKERNNIDTSFEKFNFHMISAIGFLHDVLNSLSLWYSQVKCQTVNSTALKDLFTSMRLKNVFSFSVECDGTKIGESDDVKVNIDEIERISYRCLIGLGDICRYILEFYKPDALNISFEKIKMQCQCYYILASNLYVNDGLVYNQLASLSLFSKGSYSNNANKMTALFYYVKSLMCVDRKFVGVEANLKRFLVSNHDSSYSSLMMKHVSLNSGSGGQESVTGINSVEYSCVVSFLEFIRCLLFGGPGHSKSLTLPRFSSTVVSGDEKVEKHGLLHLTQACQASLMYMQYLVFSVSFQSNVDDDNVTRRDEINVAIENITLKAALTAILAMQNVEDISWIAGGRAYMLAFLTQLVSKVLVDLNASLRTRKDSQQSENDFNVQTFETFDEDTILTNLAPFVDRHELAVEMDGDAGQKLTAIDINGDGEYTDRSLLSDEDNDSSILTSCSEDTDTSSVLKSVIQSSKMKKSENLRRVRRRRRKKHKISPKTAVELKTMKNSQESVDLCSEDFSSSPSAEDSSDNFENMEGSSEEEDFDDYSCPSSTTNTSRSGHLSKEDLPSKNDVRLTEIEKERKMEAVSTFLSTHPLTPALYCMLKWLWMTPDLYQELCSKSPFNGSTSSNNKTEDDYTTFFDRIAKLFTLLNTDSSKVVVDGKKDDASQSEKYLIDSNLIQGMDCFKDFFPEGINVKDRFNNEMIGLAWLRSFDEMLSRWLISPEQSSAAVSSNVEYMTKVSKNRLAKVWIESNRAKDDPKKVPVIRVIDDQLKEREGQMKSLAKLWLQHEVSNLEDSRRRGGGGGQHNSNNRRRVDRRSDRHSRRNDGRFSISGEDQYGHEEDLCVYVILDEHTLTSRLSMVKRIVRDERFVLVVPVSVLQLLDEMKSEKFCAREVIRWLERKFHQGNKWIRLQHSSESHPLIVSSNSTTMSAKSTNHDGSSKGDFLHSKSTIFECAYHFSMTGNEDGYREKNGSIVGRSREQQQRIKVLTTRANRNRIRDENGTSYNKMMDFIKKFGIEYNTVEAFYDNTIALSSSTWRPSGGGYSGRGGGGGRWEDHSGDELKSVGRTRRRRRNHHRLRDSRNKGGRGNRQVSDMSNKENVKMEGEGGSSTHPHRVRYTDQRLRKEKG